MATNAQLKTYFQTGDKPTESQFAELIDSKLSVDFVYTASILSGSSITIDFNYPYQDLYLQSNTTFTSSNLSAVKQVNLRMVTDGTNRLTSWPADWKWLNASMPVSQSANTSALLSLMSWGTTSASVQAVYTGE